MNWAGSATVRDLPVASIGRSFASGSYRISASPQCFNLKHKASPCIRDSETKDAVIRHASQFSLSRRDLMSLHVGIDGAVCGDEVDDCDIQMRPSCKTTVRQESVPSPLEEDVFLRISR
jgi:hypothetical protein